MYTNAYRGESKAWSSCAGASLFALETPEAFWGVEDLAQGPNIDVTILGRLGLKLAIFQSQPERPTLRRPTVTRLFSLYYLKLLGPHPGTAALVLFC